MLACRRQKNRSILTIGLIIATTFSFSVASAQNVIINGDFETGPYDTIGVVSDWVVAGNVGEVGDEGFTSPSHAAAFSLGGNSEGNMLSQSFATTMGQVYTLDFDAGVYGVRSLGPLQLQVQVIGSETLLDQTVTPPYNGNFNPAPFDHFDFMFTADSALTTLKFIDIGLGNNAADVILDTVVVEATAIPEPSSVALTAVGIGALVPLLRKRRAGAAILPLNRS